MYISFGDAIKAFRHLNYKYGPDVLAYVLCETHNQRKYAYGECGRMLEGGSLEYTVDAAKFSFTTIRGGTIKFILDTDGWEDRIRGTHPTQVIMFDTAPPEKIEERTQWLKAAMGRHPAIDSNDERVDIASL